MRERLATVCRLVDAVAERGRLTVVRFARADVHDARIGRMDRDIADRRAVVGFEHGRERRPVVLRLEHASDCVADVDDVRIALRYGDIVDASSHAGWPNRTELEA